MFNVGDYITIKKEYDWIKWYHTEPMCILEVKNINEIIAYKTDYVFDKQFYGIDGFGSTLLMLGHYVELSVAHIRDDKLEKLIK